MVDERYTSIRHLVGCPVLAERSKKESGKILKKQKLLLVLLLTMFAVGTLAAAFPVGASVSTATKLTITRPDKVVPGGGVELYFESFSATGGTIYFYFSENDDPEITEGDIFVSDMKRTDFEAELPYVTIYAPDTIEADKYYVKITDLKRVGADAVASASMTTPKGASKVEVITEDLPTITVDPTSGTIAPTQRKVTVEGSDILSDYWDHPASLYWVHYEVAMTYIDAVTPAVKTVVDGEFSFKRVKPIPPGYDERAWVPKDTYTTMGARKILVLLTDGSVYLGTFVVFEVKPSIEISAKATYSIKAEAADQNATITPHGFPKGTIDPDTVKFIVKDIRTGEVLESITSDHPKATITKHGTSAAFTCGDVDDAPAGTIDFEFKVDTTTFTLADKFLSSKPGDPGALLGKMTKTEGKIDDEVDFMGIKLPAGVAVDVTFDDDVSISVATVDATTFYADSNGGWKYTFALKKLAGDTYTVKIWDKTNGRSKTIGTFEVLPNVKFYSAAGTEITSTHVGDSIYIGGTAFPVDSEFKTIEIGTGTKRFDDWIAVSADFTWTSPVFAVPHTSGGGQKVPVSILGRVDTETTTIESEIKIKPIIAAGYCKYLDPDGRFYATTWVNGTGKIFAGNPMKIEGWGFLTGEEVSVSFVDPATGEVVATAEVTDGGKADADGDLEAVFSVPLKREFKFTKVRDIKVAGTTNGNSYKVKSIEIDALDDLYAKLFTGLEPDGDLDFTWAVGSEVRVVGVGFVTEDLTITIDTKELKEVTSEYGYFDTTVTVPSKVRGWYDLREYETGVETGIFVQSKVVLSPSEAASKATVTATGTGFDEEEDVDIYWPGMEEELASLTTDSSGEFTQGFTVPVDTPGTYAILFDAETLEDTEEFTYDFPSPLGEVTVEQSDLEVDFTLLGALRIVSLGLPTEVYNGSSVLITVNVQDFVGTPITKATVTGSVTPAVGTAVSLTFTEAAAGIYTATYKVPVDAKEGSYRVDVKASKPEAGGEATSSGTFYVSIKGPVVPPPPPVDIGKILAAVAAVTSDVTKLSGSVSTLASDVAGLKTSVAALSTGLADLKKSVAAIPVIPIELIYGIAIISIIAAIAAIAAVFSIYRKIA